MSRRFFTAVLITFAGLGTAFAPADAADLCLDLKFKCDGFEPNWQLFTDVVADGSDTVVRFTDPENPNWETEPLIVDSCLLQGSPNDFELTTDAPLSLVANIVGQSCTEPNDELTDFSVTVTFIQGALSDHPSEVQGTGCCQMLE
jgi:hypothetical protein